jgi:predicted nucleotidyltransferase component of viral defense system
MIFEELESLTAKLKKQNKPYFYIKNLLKEFLQIYVLNFVYLNKHYGKNFIFTSGTCLRHCFGLNRLSEDLDFDLEKPLDADEFKRDLENYFKTEYLYKDVQISVLQRGQQILLKFPVLRKLKVATKSESDLLYVKIDLSSLLSKNYLLHKTLKSSSQFNYLMIHYDLPSLMAGKMHAILMRNRLIGKENEPTIKGRDYYDLLWFLEKKTNPNWKRLNDLLESSYTISEMILMIDKKVIEAVTLKRQNFKQDLFPFLDNPQILDGYIDSYLENYERYKAYLS